MTGKATVISVHQNTADVRICKESACGHNCGECRLCNNPGIITTVLNPIGAKPGDTVTVGADTGKVLGAAFVLYVLPVFVAIVLGTLTFNLWGAALATVCTLIWIAVWFVTMRRYNANINIQSTIVEVINEKN